MPDHNLRALNDWMHASRAIIAPIFDEDDLAVKTKPVRNRQVLCISDNLKETIISVVDNNIGSSDWQGFLYIMCKKYLDKDREFYFPLYVGKTEKEGRKHPISSNLLNIRNNTAAFARWGNGNYWHIGQLSNSLFNQSSGGRHDNWAEELFKKPYQPPILKMPIYLVIINWHMGISINLYGSNVPLHPNLESEIIQFSKQINPNLLNKKGKNKNRNRNNKGDNLSITSNYNLRRANGGIHDEEVGIDLNRQIESLLRGDKIHIHVAAEIRWTGQDTVEIQNHFASFERRNHTYSPVINKSVVRAIYRAGLTGRFEIESENTGIVHIRKL